MPRVRSLIDPQRYILNERGEDKTKKQSRPSIEGQKTTAGKEVLGMAGR